jgi:hypothetical protein
LTIALRNAATWAEQLLDRLPAPLAPPHLRRVDADRSLAVVGDRVNCGVCSVGVELEAYEFIEADELYFSTHSLCERLDEGRLYLMVASVRSSPALHDGAGFTLSCGGPAIAAPRTTGSRRGCDHPGHDPGLRAGRRMLSAGNECA